MEEDTKQIINDLESAVGQMKVVVESSDTLGKS